MNYVFQEFYRDSANNEEITGEPGAHVLVDSDQNLLGVVCFLT
jgi:hypothetical protein